MIPSKKLTIESICKSIGIDTPEVRMDRNMDNCQCHCKGDEIWHAHAREYVIAESDYICEFCEFDYQGAVESFYEKLLENFHLTLVKLDDGTYELAPTRGWYRAAKELIETINGVGLFEFKSVSEGILSGPYEGSKGFVMNHVGWIPDYVRVYEGGTALTKFFRSL